jgi:hypothetical protein
MRFRCGFELPDPGTAQTRTGGVAQSVDVCAASEVLTSQRIASRFCAGVV